MVIDIKPYYKVERTSFKRTTLVIGAQHPISLQINTVGTVTEDTRVSKWLFSLSKKPKKRRVIGYLISLRPRLNRRASSGKELLYLGSKILN